MWMRKQEEHHDPPRALCAHSPGLYLAAVALTLFPSGASAYHGDRTTGGGSRWYRGGYRLQGNYGGRAIIEQDDPTTLCIISDKPSSTSAWVMVWNNQPAPDWEWIQAGCVVFDHTLNDAYPTKVSDGWIGQDGAHGIDAILARLLSPGSISAFTGIAPSPTASAIRRTSSTRRDTGHGSVP